MKTLARNELDTDVTIYLGAIKKGLVPLKWREINGILIAGKPGSGKTNTAVWIANQLAAQGIKLVRMEYEADESNAQTFINQTSHLAYADFMQYAIEKEDIENTIAALYELGLRRRKSGTPDNANQYPIAIMIDEITSLLSMKSDKIEVISKEQIDEDTTKKTTKTERTLMNNLNDMLRMFRKANIKFIVMGQNWQASGNASNLAQFRRNFNTTLLHRINAKDVDLFDVASTELKKTIQGLKPGTFVYQERVVYVPYMAKYPMLNVKAVAKANQYPEMRYARINAPLINTTYPKLDGRWSKTRVLAHLLDVDFKTLKQKGLYN